MEHLFSGIYKNKTVLVTGHTGFKGSWLVYWLREMGADVIGYSLDELREPNHISLLKPLSSAVVGDIRNLEHLQETFAQYKPDIVFHLAAQALVRDSYRNPIETYETNVMGTLNVLEASRRNGVKVIVNITSDKAYKNREWLWAYRESDALGGHDPYSASKACADIVASSYRDSYFNREEYKDTHETLLVTCRAGNVIGGGDWAKDRLFSDMMLSVSKNSSLLLRNPTATRPWQHVLEPLSGYLLLGQKLLEGREEFSGAWNFGPSETRDISVEELVKIAQQYWSKIVYTVVQDENNLHEAHSLKLDSSKAHVKLQWQNVWSNEETLRQSVAWYKAYYEESKVLTSTDLVAYIKDAEKKNLQWTKK